MNKRSFLSFLIFFVSHIIYAQELPPENTTRFFNLGVGYTLPKFLDHSFSTLRYQGHAVSATGGFHFRAPHRLHHLDFRFDYGQLSNASNFATVDYFRFEGNYAYKKFVKNLWKDRLQWFVGGSFNSLWTLWIYQGFVNNSYNNSVYASLSPNTSFVYHFELFQRQFRAEAAVFIPILTFAMRPSYGTTRFPGFLDDDRDDTLRQIWESGQFASFNKFFRYSNTISLEYFMKNANRLRLSYEWNFLRYQEPRVVNAASHNITIATMFNF